MIDNRVRPRFNGREDWRMSPDNGKVDGMGAIPRPDGVAFRVWAPNARKVALVGTFNGWDGSRHLMEREGNGCWYAKVPEAAAGHEYRYLLSTSTGNIWRMDPYARQVTDSNGNAVVPDPEFDWEGDQFRMPPWNELVIYEMHVGTFNAAHGDQVGTFATAAARLKYLADLGINAIEVMPIAEFEGSRSWGYNPAHLFAVETAYGGSRAFKAFVKECHRHGIAVILDVVYNHLGPNHLDLWRFDGWHNHDFGGIYFYNDGRARTPWGHTRPDYGRPEVRRFLRDNALMWLEEYHVDGLRCDATNYIRATSESGGQDIPEGWLFLQELTREVRERYPGRIAIAEDLQHNPRLTQDARHGGAGFGSQWDPTFLCALRAAAVVPYDECRPLRRVKEALTSRYNHDAFQRIIYTESHDDVACGSGKARLSHEINPGDPNGWHAQKRVTLASAVLLTAPGIPMLFQGQEFLESRSFSDVVPLDWGRGERHRGLVQLHRDLIALRLNRGGATRGLCGQHVNVHHLNQSGQVVAYHRWDRGGPRDDAIVVANFSHRAYHNYVVGLPRSGNWQLRFNSDWRGYSDRFCGTLSGDAHAAGGWYDGMPYHAALTIGPYSVLIFSQDH
jgi:1,4-alpha-glucan branching enzyme